MRIVHDALIILGALTAMVLIDGALGLLASWLMNDE